MATRIIVQLETTDRINPSAYCSVFITHLQNKEAIAITSMMKLFRGKWGHK